MGVENNAELSVGYEEFDSTEFEGNQTLESEEEKKEASETSDEAVDSDKKLTAEEAFGSGETEEKVEETEVKDGVETKSADQPDYTPNLTYKVYDKDKDFPDQLKPLVKDKETEDYFRTLLSKSDGLDEMKPLHQNIVGERDQLKSQVDFYKRDVNRVLDVRDKNPHVFCAELGISDDWILKRAKEIVIATETPEQEQQFNQVRKLQVENYNHSLAFEQNNQMQFQNTVSSIQQNVQSAMSHPEISSFRGDFDRLHGIGAFEREVQKQGYFHYEETKRKTGQGVNLDPAEVVKQVYEFHKKAFAPVANVQQVVADVKPAPTTRIQHIPNVGKGRNVSPTGQRRPKNIAELRAMADAQTS